MNYKLLFLKCIGLIFWGQIIHPGDGEYHPLVERIVDLVDVSDDLIKNNEDNQKLTLKIIITELINQSGSLPLTDLLTRLKVDLCDDPNYYKILEDELSLRMGSEDIEKYCYANVLFLKRYLTEEQISRKIIKAGEDLKYRRSKIKDHSEFVKKLKANIEIEQEVESQLGLSSDEVVISFSEHSELANVLKELKSKMTKESIMITGFQGFNDMFRGGIRRGDLIVTNALSHNFKTQFTLACFISIALYNKPYLYTPGKKPLLLLVSYEDGPDKITNYIYNILMGNEDTEFIPFQDADEKEVSSFIHKKLSANGYEVKFIKANPHLETYKTIINRLHSYEKQGYEIHLMYLDYLALVSREGCRPDIPTGTALLDLFSKVKNYCQPKGITVWTPHQLSSAATTLLREGRSDFVKQLPGRGFYKDCSTLINELDCDFYIHIEEFNNEKYLTIQRGKHKLAGQTAAKHLFGVLKMDPNAGLLFDIGKPNSILSKVGGGKMGDKNDMPYWEFE